jgi:type I restriction enzyme S subunit
MGQSPDAKSYNATGEGLPLINGPVEFSQGEFGKTIRSKFTTQPSKLCRENDLILCVRGSTTGRMNIAGFDACVGRGVAAIRAKQYQPWINYFISWKRDEIYELGTGATFPNVSGTMLSALQLLVPPLPEQQRIVAILDEAFDGIATAKANAEKNLQNARALFESHLQSIFSRRGDGWLHTTIGDQLMLQRGFDITKNAQNQGDVPVVSSGGIKSFHDKAMAKGPGVAIGRKGTLGKVFYLEVDFWPHDTTLWVKNFKGNEPRFVYYFLVGLDVRHLDSGTANPALNRNQVHPIQIDWPPISQQKKFVATLDALSVETQRLESIYQQKLAALEALKKSLLHQAFSGQL